MSEMEQKLILIVDDDSVVLRTMKDSLSDGFKIIGANSGPNALKVLEKKQADLILLDYEMPEMNGEEVLKTLKGNDTLASIPVMFLSGLNSAEIEAKGLPVERVLNKTMPAAELKSLIAEFFKEKEA